MIDSNAIAYDPGYANSKTGIHGKVGFIQTAISKPKDIGIAASGMKSIGKNVHTVEFDGHKFCVGPGAWYKGDPITSMDYMSITSPARTAAFYASLHITNEEQPISMRDATLMVGLPVPLMRDALQGAVVTDSLRKFKRGHRFTVNGVEHFIEITKASKLAQPLGAYFNWYYDDELKARAGAKHIEVAILDWGMNTLDLYVVKGNEVAETYIGGAEVGMKNLLEEMNTDGRDLSELDAMLRDEEIKPTKEQIEAWVGACLAEIKKTMPDLRRFGLVIPVGGSVVVADQELTAALMSKRANVYRVKDPITDNVSGLYKFAARNS